MYKYFLKLSNPPSTGPYFKVLSYDRTGFDTWVNKKHATEFTKEQLQAVLKRYSWGTIESHAEGLEIEKRRIVEDGDILIKETKRKIRL
jgi:hypothetical protein